MYQHQLQQDESQGYTVDDGRRRPPVGYPQDESDEYEPHELSTIQELETPKAELEGNGEFSVLGRERGVEKVG